jgi:hypothetical protein
VPPFPTIGEAVGAGGDDLRAGEALLEAVEAVGVDGDVAVEKRVLELVGGALTLSAVCTAFWSLTFERVLMMNVSTSASPPRIDERSRSPG